MNLLYYNNKNYIICFIGNNKFINFFHYDVIDNKLHFKQNKTHNITIESPMGFSCQIYQDSKRNNQYSLICFYIYESKLYGEIFDANNFTSINKNKTSCGLDNQNNVVIKSVLGFNGGIKFFICWGNINLNSSSFCTLLIKGQNNEINFKPNYNH